MTEELEEALKGTLQGAAMDAPVPHHDLLTRVARRHRVRRRNRVGLVIAAMLVIVAGSGVLAAGLGSGGDGHGGRVISPHRKPGSLQKAPPIENVWPQALQRVPKQLSDGRKFRPLTMLDDGRLLVEIQIGDSFVAELRTYDIATTRSELVTQVSMPRGTDLNSDLTTGPQGITVGDGQVVWWWSYKLKKQVEYEIRAVPLTGGVSRKVTTIDQGSVKELSVSRMVVDDGKVRWTQVGADDKFRGVFEAPLSGGSAVIVPGTEGQEILRWPWLGSPGLNQTGSQDQVTFQKLYNAETKRSTTTKLQTRGITWVCGLTWCVGNVSFGPSTDKDLPNGTFVQRRDGSGAIRFKDEDPRDGMGVRDRFLIFLLSTPDGREGVAMYDLESEQAVNLGINQDGISDSDDPDNRLLYAERADHYLIIDLDAIN